MGNENISDEAKKPTPLEKYLTFVSRLLKEQKYAEAENLYKHILKIYPHNTDVLLRLAVLQESLGKTGETIDTCKHILQTDPGNLDAHILMAETLQPGDNYLTVLQKFHRNLIPESYVEIGVETGQSLSLALPQTKALGIDPYLQLRFPLTPATKTFEMTSDDFFAHHDLLKELGTKKVDMAFIDGLHMFEQVLKDFMNIEAYAAKNSVILLHDSNPLDRETSSRTRETDFWSGDSWKALVCLKELRPDLTIFTIPASPTGLGVISNLDPDSTVLKDHYHETVEKFMPMDFDFLEKNKEETLNIIPNNWEKIVSLLPGVFK